MSRAAARSLCLSDQHEGRAERRDGEVDHPFIQTAGEASLEGGVPSLAGVGPSTLCFSDRPERVGGNTVDIKKATDTNDIGDTQLAAVWTDPASDPAPHAVYDGRVLEIPTPRWTTLMPRRSGSSR